MFKKIKLLFNTLKHLKSIQVFYQIYYRLKPIKTLANYIPHNKIIQFQKLHFRYTIITISVAESNGTFNFLNVSKKNSDKIDWKFGDYGKLWNYNLQYFNYLNQHNLDKNVKDNWIIDVAQWLKIGKLKLEPYPVSLRVMNIIRYCSLQEEPHPTILQDTYGQLNYLSKHLEFHLLGNHLLENVFALIMGGAAFSEKEWLNTSKRLLYKQLNEQILSDGAHFELSPMYHQIILFRILELIDWYQNYDNADKDFLLFLKQKANKMLSWLKAISFSNGDIPHLNDSAPDIALSSKELFDFATTLGINGISPNALNDSGYRKYVRKNYECVVDVAQLGPAYQPGHGHCDALSFILYVAQQPLIVDVGTSTYQIGQRRNYERSTFAHNTVVVQNQNQSEVWGGFRLGKRASVKIINESPKQLEAKHDGYYDRFKVYHTRKFNFRENAIEIVDHIGNADSKLLLHFHPNCNVLITEKKNISLNQQVLVAFENANEISLNEYEFAEGFNKYRKAFKVEVDFKNTIKTTISFL